MGITHTSWDFKIMKAESDMEALIKLIRLIGNLLTVENIGYDVITNKQNIYRELIKRLVVLLTNKEIAKESELIFCCLSCLANGTYFEK